MLYSIKNRENLEKLNELVSLETKVKAIRLRDKLDKQNYHYDAANLYEPLTDTIKDTSRNITKTITETSTMNSTARENYSKIFRINEK